MATARLPSDQFMRKITRNYSRNTRSSVTEYDKTLEPDAVDMSNMPSFHKNKRQNTQLSGPSTSDPCDDDVIIVTDSTHSTSNNRSYSNYRYSSSSLPATTNNSKHNNRPLIELAPVTKYNSSFSPDPNKDTQSFTDTSNSFARSVMSNSRASKRYDLSDCGHGNNTDDDDFELPVSSRNRAKRNNSTSFYGKDTDKSQQFPTKRYPSSLTGVSSTSGTVNEPFLVEDTTSFKSKGKKPRLNLRPTLSSRMEFEEATLEIENLKLGKNRSFQGKTFKFTTDEIFIVFENQSKEETKQTFIQCDCITHADVFLDDPPFLIALTINDLCRGRLNTFLGSIHSDFKPFQYNHRGQEKMIIVTFKTSTPTDRLTQDVFESCLKILKSKPPHKPKKSVEQYMNILENEQQVPTSTSTCTKPVPLSPPPLVTYTNTPPAPRRSIRQRPPSPSLALSSALETVHNTRPSKTEPTSTVSPIDIPDTPKSTYKDNESVLTYVFKDSMSSKGAASNFVISGQDMNSLDDQSYLNDQIINFYLRYFWEGLSDAMKDSVYIFSTFFYSRLVNSKKDDKNNSLDLKDKIHNRVKSWTKSVNIFEKRFILVPVCYRSHWFIAILCNIADYTVPHSLKVSSAAQSNAGHKRKTPRKKLLKRKRRKTNTLEKNQTVLEVSPVPEISPVSEIEELLGGGEKHESSTSSVNMDDLAGVSCDNANGIPEEISGCDSVTITTCTDGSSTNSMEKMEVDTIQEDEPSGCGTDGCDLDVMVTEEDGCDPSIMYITESSPEGNGAGNQTIEEEEIVDVVMDGQQVYTEDTEIKSCLIVLDSMLIKRRAVGNNLTRYLTVEYSRKFPGENKDFSDLPILWPKVPPQNNGFDCGVYVLTYIENFFKHVEHDNRLPSCQEWIGDIKMKSRRRELREKLLSLKNSSTDHSPCSSRASSSHSSPVHL